MSRLTPSPLAPSQAHQSSPARPARQREPSDERGFKLPEPSRERAADTRAARAAAASRSAPPERPDARPDFDARKPADRGTDLAERRADRKGPDRSDRTTDAGSRHDRTASPADEASSVKNETSEKPDGCDDASAGRAAAEEVAADVAPQDTAGAASPLPVLAAGLAASAAEAGKPGSAEPSASRGGKVREISARQGGARGPEQPSGEAPAAPAAAAPDERGVAKTAIAAIGGERSEGAEEEGRATSTELGRFLLSGPSTSDVAAALGAGTKPAFAELLGEIPSSGGAKAHAAQAVVTNVPVGSVPIEIGLKSLEGVNRFEIRLTPEELGRVDVRLEIDDRGEVKAHLVVERPEALALLTRDRGQLERAFEQAGLKASEDGVAFSLRDGTGGQSFSGSGGKGEDASSRPRGPDGAPGIDGVPAGIVPRQIVSRLGALDLRI